MSEMFYFNCEFCDDEVLLILLEGAYGWIDYNGNFGTANYKGEAITGKPAGEIKPVTYSCRYCPRCGESYVIVFGNSYGIHIKRNQKIESGKVWKIYDNIEHCPQCQGKLHTGKEILNHVINRDDCWGIKCEPFKNTSKVLKCPKCKEGHLLYKQYFRMD